MSMLEKLKVTFEKVCMLAESFALTNVSHPNSLWLLQKPIWK